MTAGARCVVMLASQFEERHSVRCSCLWSPEHSVIWNYPHSSSSARSGSLEAIATRAACGRPGWRLSSIARENDVLIRRADDPSDESQVADPSTISGDVGVRQRLF
jgi:hypothetical protein